MGKAKGFTRLFQATRFYSWGELYQDVSRFGVIQYSTADRLNSQFLTHRGQICVAAGFKKNQITVWRVFLTENHDKLLYPTIDNFISRHWSL